jgi:peptide methionine sulfoxide reductase msrA/msrB
MKEFKAASLPAYVVAIVQNKGTEPPFSGEFENFDGAGTYLCRLCGLALFRSATKFHSGCGWPSFDEEIPNAVKRETDKDGKRIEILCARCDAHLGHVFTGEMFTAKDTRHCVNSLSLDFIHDKTVLDTSEAIFAAGCFWGVEYYFKQLKGVLKTEVGYCGGVKENPTYEEVCHGRTGHFEAIRVIFDPKQISYEKLAQFFFEIHNPEQTDGQGPDKGDQYLSVAFYYDKEQQQSALELIKTLENKGLDIATQVLPVSIFWRAEDYHQDYYAKTGKMPYCHRHVPIF